MKLAGMLMVHNEIVTGNLERCLKSLVRYCDYIVMYDDGSTDGTQSVADSFLKKSVLDGQIKDYILIMSTKNDFENELAHKQEQLDICKQIGVDWVFRIDADETLAEDAISKIRSHLNENVTGFAFHTINLWRSPCFYRLDNSYNDVVFNRLWRVHPGLHFNVERGLHLTNYPVGATDNEIILPYQIIHWGFASDKAIIDKYNMYKSHGQAGWALNRLIDESTLRLARSKPEWFENGLPNHKFDEVFNGPISDKVEI